MLGLEGALGGGAASWQFGDLMGVKAEADFSPGAGVAFAASDEQRAASRGLNVGDGVVGSGHIGDGQTAFGAAGGEGNFLADGERFDEVGVGNRAEPEFFGAGNAVVSAGGNFDGRFLQGGKRPLEASGDNRFAIEAGEGQGNGCHAQSAGQGGK